MTDKNIVLIGMPTSGKTTMTALTAERLGMPYIELDDEVSEEIGMSITECFRTHGEAFFRQAETECIRMHMHDCGTLISCGGGVVKDPENMRMLKENGIILWLDRDLDKLYTTASRPLSTTREQLTELYEERIGLYRMYADVRIDNNGTIEETAEQIIRAVQEYEG